MHLIMVVKLQAVGLLLLKRDVAVGTTVPDLKKTFLAVIAVLSLVVAI